MSELDFLFQGPGRLLNIKISRGTKPVISYQEMVAELRDIHDQKVSGQARLTGPAKSNRPKVDVRELCARLGQGDRDK